MRIGPTIGPGIRAVLGAGGSRGNGINTVAFFGQSNTNGFGTAFVANQIKQVNLCFAYPAVKMLDHLATINGDPLVWTFNRPSGIPSNGTIASLTPVSLSARTAGGDTNGDFSADLSMMRALDRALPGKWFLAKMGIPSSSMLNWLAVGSTYPTALPHLIDQLLTFLAQAVATSGGQLAACVFQQGESDCQTGPLSTAWQSRVTDLIAAVRTVYGTVPFFLPKMHTGAGGPGLATVQAAQATLASTLSQVYVINTDLIPGGSPGALHYTPSQYADAGPIYADRICGVLGLNQPPTALFSWSWSSTTVTFTDGSTDRDGTIASWAWDFGDGTTSTSQNPVHVYGALGTYTVQLTVTDNGGATGSVTRLVTCAAGNWTVDTKAGFAVPTNNTEWTALMTAAGLGFVPNSSRRPGSVAATPIGDDLGAFPLTVAGATVELQSVHPSCSTLGMRTINNVTDGASSTDAALPDAGTTSILAFCIAAIWTVPTANRGLFSLGTTETRVSFNSSNPPRMIASSNTQAVTGTADLDNQPHFHVLRHNRTNSTCKYFSDLESFSVTFAGSVTGKRERFGLTALTSPGAQFFLHGRIDGANAEMSDAQIRTLGRTMGFFMP